MTTQLDLLPLQFPKEAYQFGQRSDGEIHGVVLTKPHIVELILDLAGYKAGEDLTAMKLLEPSCGHGAFLLPAVKRLLDTFKLSDFKLSDLKNAVTAFDIDPEHVAKTKSELVKLLATYEISRKDAAKVLSNHALDGLTVRYEYKPPFKWLAQIKNNGGSEEWRPLVLRLRTELLEYAA